jgi:REP element-mobilizing transposase RayT
MPRRARTLATGEYYHLYNRGNNRQAIFFERENYLYFLRQFRYFVAAETADVVAYCLMPNHYHLLVYSVRRRAIEGDAAIYDVRTPMR